MNPPENKQHATPEDGKLRYQRIIKILAKTCARIVLSVNRPAQDFIRAFNEGLIDLLRKHNPRMTIAEMTLRTGIDRRQISRYLKQEPVAAWQKRNAISMILAEIERSIQAHFPDGVLPLTGEPDSFEAICRRLVAGKLHATAVLKELLRLGNIEEAGNGIRLKSIDYYPQKDSLDFLNMTVWALDQLGQTIEYNRLTPNAAQRNFQRSVYSTQIPPWTVEKLHPKLKGTLEKYHAEVAAMLKKAEDKNTPVGFYPAYGASFFELGRTSEFRPSDQQLLQEIAIKQTRDTTDN